MNSKLKSSVLVWFPLPGLTQSLPSVSFMVESRGALVSPPSRDSNPISSVYQSTLSSHLSLITSQRLGLQTSHWKSQLLCALNTISHYSIKDKLETSRGVFLMTGSFKIPRKERPSKEKTKNKGKFHGELRAEWQVLIPAPRQTIGLWSASRVLLFPPHCVLMATTTTCSE